MIFAYDPILVMLSVLVAVIGSYTCFNLVIQIRKKSHRRFDKKLLIGASFIIGGSIWVMHFIAMLAVQLSIVIRYDILATVISGLISVLMTGLALVIVSTAAENDNKRVVLAGIIMGVGISAMHYVGMSAIRGNCGVLFEGLWIAISVGIGILASTTSLFAAMKLHGLSRRLVAALVMGISISGVHYTGMLGTSFITVDNALSFSQPVLSPFSLGLGVAIITFFILGYTLYSLVPNKMETQAPGEVLQPGSPTDSAIADVAEEEPEIVEHFAKIPLQKNKKTYFVNVEEIVSISANGHYTTINTANDEEYFCNYSLSGVQEKINEELFLRVHRSHIVNIQFIKSLQRQHDKGLVFMQGFEKGIPVSRTYISTLEKTLSR